MTTFKSWCGLNMNENKTDIFFGGFTELQAAVIRDLSGFKRGTFPTRYLGLPLNPKKISLATLQPFLERITSKLHSYTAKYLSFAGKVTLITSVVYGMVNFWSSVFVLPKSFYGKVDSLCAAFLWNNKTNTAAGARVAWEAICKPKLEGELGIRKLEEFEMVFRLKRLWNYFTNSGSLWVAWIKHNIFNDRSFWLITDAQRFSPSVRSMLQLKPKLDEFMRCQVKNGNKALFWFDYWTDLGPLHLMFGPTGTRDLRIPTTSTVAEATSQGFWSIPPARSDEMVTLHVVLSTMNPPSPSMDDDEFLWRGPSNNFVKEFSPKVTWNMVRQRVPVVPWCSLVWFKQNIPRCSFVIWMAVLARLPTRDRLSSWGMAVPTSCVLCPTGDETYDHLFFQCAYTARVWASFSRRFNVSSITNFSSSVAFCHRLHDDLSPDVATVFKLVLQVFVYTVWRERNARIFKGECRSEETLFATMDRLVRDRLLSCPATPNRPRSLLQLYFWFIEPYS